MKTNALYYGDNLEILRKDIDAESIDLYRPTIQFKA
jgi:hypothetical protein